MDLVAIPVKESQSAVVMARRIMIVDDDEEIRATLAELLAQEGFEVIEASDGIDALDRLSKEALPNLILLDLMMPKMDGWGFQSEVQKDAALASIPIVVMTAAGQKTSNTIPVKGVLHKPFSLDAVV